MSNINAGDIVYYGGPTENCSISSHDMMLVLASGTKKYAMVQILYGKLAGHILYMPYSFINTRGPEQ